MSILDISAPLQSLHVPILLSCWDGDDVRAGFGQLLTEAASALPWARMFSDTESLTCA